MTELNLKKESVESMIEELLQIVGNGNVSINEEPRTLVSTDLSWLSVEIWPLIQVKN
jgi:hypothetical protein